MTTCTDSVPPPCPRNQFFQGEGRNDSFTRIYIASDYHHNESLLLLLLCTKKTFEQYAFALSRRVGALQISIIYLFEGEQPMGNNYFMI